MNQQPDQRHPMFPVILLSAIFLCIIWVILIIKKDMKENKQIKYLLVGGGKTTCNILEQIQQFLEENKTNKTNTNTLEVVCITFKIEIENFAKQIIKCYGNYNDQKPILTQLLDILNNEFNIKITDEFYNLVEKLLKDQLLQVGTHMEIFVQNTLGKNSKLKDRLSQVGIGIGIHMGKGPLKYKSKNYLKYLKYKTKYLELKKLLE